MQNIELTFISCAWTFLVQILHIMRWMYSAWPISPKIILNLTTNWNYKVKFNNGKEALVLECMGQILKHVM